MISELYLLILAPARLPWLWLTVSHVCSRTLAQVVADLQSDKTVEYIRSLEAQVAKYRQEVQVGACCHPFLSNVDDSPL